MAQIEIKCVMDSEFCKGNTWYQIRSMSDHVVYVYLDKHEFVGLPKCHFDMDNIRELKEQAMQKVIHDSDCSLHNEPAYPNGDCDCSVSTQEISKDNIVEVLKFNNIDQHRYKIDDDTIACFSDVNNVWAGTAVLFKCPEWLQIVEVYFGKLKPLPKANPFDVVKVGDWVRSKKTLYHYQCQLPYRTKDKWYQRVELNNKKCFVCNSNGSGYSSSDSPCDWDLTDIRDYNPTECELKVGDVIEFDISHQVVKIVEFNYLNKSIVGGTSFITFDSIDYVAQNCTINGRKYDKITIPKFDFVKCLVDAGFTLNGDGDLYAIGSSWNESIICLEKKDDRQWFLNCSSNLTEATPANAQIIVSMANLAKGIK